MTTTIRLLSSFSLAVLLGAGLSAQGDLQKPVTSSKPATSPATPVGTAGASETSRANTSSDYKLVAGDQLRIEVYKDAQLSQNVQIRPDGKITLPLVGDLVAAGLTPTELKDTITKSLRAYNESPNLADLVTVIVVETVPPVVYVMGEVNSPGPQPIVGEVTVLQALATAGGFKDFAKTRDIRIQRKGPAGVTTLYFDYKDAVNGKGKTIYVQPGDTIIVP